MAAQPAGASPGCGVEAGRAGRRGRPGGGREWLLGSSPQVCGNRAGATSVAAWRTGVGSSPPGGGENRYHETRGSTVYQATAPPDHYSSADPPPTPAADRRRHARAARRARARLGARAGPQRARPAPARLSLRLTYTQAVQEAGGIAVVLPAHGFVDDIGRCSTASTACSSAAGRTSTRRPTATSAIRCSAPTSTRRRRVRARAAARGHRARPAAARDLPRDAGAQRRPRRDAAPAPARPHRARPPPDPRGRTSPRTRSASRAGSPLHRLTGRRRLEVNSFHHQAVDTLGTAWRLRPRAGRHDRGALRPRAALLPRRPVARRAAHPPRRARAAAAASWWPRRAPRPRLRCRLVA